MEPLIIVIALRKDVTKYFRSLRIDYNTLWKVLINYIGATQRKNLTQQKIIQGTIRSFKKCF